MGMPSHETVESARSDRRRRVAVGSGLITVAGVAIGLLAGGIASGQTPPCGGYTGYECPTPTPTATATATSTPTASPTATATPVATPINGGAGNDTLTGGAGSDTINGGGGND